MKTEKAFLEELELALDNAEEALRRISGQCRLQCTGHSDIFCSRLPAHWRSNKSLPTPFVILALCPITDGTRVCISAGNDENFSADVKNNTAEFLGQMARFSDLRFVGKSGRGKNFNLSITIFTNPYTQVIVVPNIVKVTVDGPRETRTTSKFLGQHISSQKNFRCYDGSHNNKADRPYEYIKTSNRDLSNSIIEQQHSQTKILHQPQSSSQNYPLGGLNLNTASAVTLMSGFFNPRLLCDSRINTNLSKDLNIANDLMLRHNLHSNANLNLFLNMRFGTLANQVTTVNNDKNKIDQKPCTEKLSSPLFNLPFSSVSLLQQSISSPMQFGNNLIKSFLPFMSSIHSNFTWPNFLTKNGTNTDLVSLQQQENFDSIPFSKQHLELSNAHNVDYITGAGTQKQKSNEGFDKEINKNNEIEVQTYENRQFSANRKRRHGGIFVNQRHFGIENTSCPQKSLSFSQEEEREKPLIKNVIEDSIHFTNMQTSQSASIKRCKLDLKDASDKETTNDSLNVNNKNDSPQQFLKPHIQQGLWRPFTL